MAANKTQDENRIVEVVFKKNMTFSEYMKMKPGIESKGYTVQAYEIGFYADGIAR